MKICLMAILFSLSFFFLSGSSIAEEHPSSENVLLYDSQPDHLWNVAQNTLFRYLGDYHPPNPGPNYLIEKNKALSELLITENTDKAIIFLEQLIADKETAHSQKPIARVIMQRNAWELFDWLATNSNPETDTSRVFRIRLAKFIQMLALSDEEIANLPNNYSNVFLNSDVELPAVNNLKLPENLFEPKSEWIQPTYKQSGRLAVTHEDFHEGRSEFLLFVNFPDGRKSGLNYLNQFNDYAQFDYKRYLVRNGILLHSNLPNIDSPDMPAGTQAILLQRYLVISESGVPEPTPIVGTIEMLDTTSFYDKKTRQLHQIKFGVFEVSLPELVIEKQTTLRRVIPGEASFGANFFPSGLKQCVICHNIGGNNLLSFSGGGFARHPDRPHNLSLKVLENGSSLTTAKWKSRHYEYGLLKGILDSFAEQNH